MEKELRRYFASVISQNLGTNIDSNTIELDPYVLVFLFPTWISKVTYSTKRRFLNGEDIFNAESMDFPELSNLEQHEKEQVLDIYRSELYAIHNIIEYYRSNMIDHTIPFMELFTNMLMDTCSTSSSITEEFVKISDHGITYYVPYDIVLDDLIKNVNINPFTNEPYSSIVYTNMRKKYCIEIKMLSKLHLLE